MATRFPGGLKRKKLSPRIFCKLSKSLSLSAGHLGSGRHIRSPGRERERERDIFLADGLRMQTHRRRRGLTARIFKVARNRMQSEPGLRGEGGRRGREEREEGKEGAAELRKWSEPFRAAVSKKLIPPNLILDNHMTKKKKKNPTTVAATSLSSRRPMEVRLYQPGNGCGAAH